MMNISLVSLYVDDPIKAFEFYTKVLGFDEKIYEPKENIAIVVSPEDPEGTAIMFEPSDNPIASPYQKGMYEQGIPAMVFCTEDFESEYERLKLVGVKFRGEPIETEDGIHIIFEDGCGNLIQLYEE